MRPRGLLLLGLVCAAGAARLAAAGKDADAWKSQVIYFLLTDRYAQAPGSTPGGPCKLTGWNNGTWSGITHNLDAIKDMGMTAVWITPIPKQVEGEYFGETGYHGYWAAEWDKLEPHYGSEADLLELLKTAKAKGVMTMLDVVANHVGPVGYNYSSIRPFNRPEHYHNCTPGCDQWCSIPQSAYESKPQNYDLITRCRLQSLPDLNQSVPYVHDALIDWLRTTVKKYDFDGLRIDTVKHVEPSFWRDFTAAAGRFTLGEVLNPDVETLVPFVSGPRPASDSVLNFPLFYALTDAFAKGGDMTKLAWERGRQYGVLGREVVSTMGNFVDNHDFPRFLTVQPDKRRLANALTWVLMAEGLPVIYYGTASGATGVVAGGANRRCLWEMPYNTSSPLYTTIERLAKFRTANKVWREPETTLTATKDCHVFSRGPGVLVATTNVGAGKDVTCSVQLPANSTLLTGGVAGVQDVLPTPAGHSNGLVWFPDTRRLTIRLTDGAPRVLTNRAAVLPRRLEGTAPAALANACPGDGNQCATAAPAPPTNEAILAKLPACFVALAVFVAALLL
ncbi:SPAC27E2.01 [Scenedesmus sp. PABB004]|nr:SPAC27E2.01 [Scenedesmus sp. PABB004]